ncbi:MAG: YigZ family protein [Eubacteriales bacterium]|nr:YigZ family protein [Eubacteriales bacterium]
MQTGNAIKPYKTILNFSEEEIIIKKSRFIGHAMPCETEEAAKDFIEKIQKKHAQASHNCYAYIIGANAGIMRYSDDGEPQGTAGIPIMNVLQNNELVNLCVVVTRYFGGVLLGAGGLVRAYTKGCSLAITASQIITMQLCRRIMFDFPYSVWDKVKYSFEQDSRIDIEKEEYGASVVTEILIGEDDLEEVLHSVRNIINNEPDCIISDPFVYYRASSPIA